MNDVNMVTEDDYDRYISLFDLPPSASLKMLDEKYSVLTMKWLNREKTDAVLAKAKLEELDDAYYQLLQEYIRNECASEAYRPREILTHSDVQLRKYEADAKNHPPYAERAVARSIEVDPTLSDWMQASSLEELLGIENDPPIFNNGKKPFEIVERSGDIFDLPYASVIVHAVSCRGVWGAGFAAQLRSRCPGAYLYYRQQCILAKPPASLAGHCLLIPPSTSQDFPSWIACLFTSVGYGEPNMAANNPGRDSPKKILINTRKALYTLRDHLVFVKSNAAYANCRPKALYSPKFNSGLFQVPWERTKSVISKCFEDYDGSWTVFTREPEIRVGVFS